MTIKENLARIRRQKKKSQVTLAKESGVSQQSISRLESGLDLTSKFLPQIARALGVPVHEIDNQFVASDGIDVVLAPLISWVSAGQLQAPDAVVDLSDAKKVAITGLDPSGDWLALKVVGDSMDRISPPDSIIFVDRKDRRLVSNACYVIQDDEEGGSSYKRYRPGKWEPVSTNKKHKPYLIKGDRGPKVIGRVKRSVLDM